MLTQALTLGRRVAAVWALKKRLASKRKSAEELEVEELTHGLVRLLPGHGEGASARTRGNISEVDRVKEAIGVLESPSSSGLESAPCSSVVGAPCSSRVPPPSWRVAAPQQHPHKNEAETPQESLELKPLPLAVGDAQVGAHKSLAANDHKSLAANAHKALPTRSTRHESLSRPSPSVTWHDEDSEDNEEMISVDQGDGNDRGHARQGDAPENLKGKRATGSKKTVTNSRPKKTLTNIGPDGVERGFEGAMPFRVGWGGNRENVDTEMESREELATAREGQELATASANAGTEALLDDLATQVVTENGDDSRVTSVMYDGEEVPQVQVSTSKHLFQNGVWGIVVGLLLALGLLVLFPNIRCCVCTWRPR